MEFKRKGITLMSLDEILQTKREDILHTAYRHGAYNVRVFGSVVRGKQILKVISTSWWIWSLAEAY
jgi:hypothetical protein